MRTLFLHKQHPYMKKILLIATFIAVHFLVYAQDDYPPREVRRPQPQYDEPVDMNRLFIGGSATVGFYSGGTVLGANPIVGYKLNDYIDAGALINFRYVGESYSGYKYRNYVYGPGVFARVYPVPFLFAQAQLEQNFTTEKQIYGGASVRNTVNAPSLLLGGGYATGRIKGGTSFFYVSILFDVLKNSNSPYVSSGGTIVPTINAGINIGLSTQRRERY